MRLKLALIEKHIHFSIVGVNENGPFELRATSFMQLTRCPDTAIVVATVVNGKIKNGDSLKIDFSNGESIIEKVQSLQIKKQDVLDAAEGKSVGIKLNHTKYESLKDLNISRHNFLI